MTSIPDSSIPSEIATALLEESNLPWDEWKEHSHFSPKWVVTFLKRQKGISSEELRVIANDKDMIHHYRIVLALVKHRSFPQALFMRFAETLRWADLLACLRLNHVAISAKTAMVSNLMQRFQFFTLGEKIAIARKAPRILMPHLRVENDPKVVSACLKNPNFTHADAMFVVAAPSSSSTKLKLIASDPKWNRFKDIRMGLLRNGSTPSSCHRKLLEGFSLNELNLIKKDPQIRIPVKNLAARMISIKSG